MNQPLISTNISINQSIPVCLNAVLSRDTPAPDKLQIWYIPSPVTDSFLPVRLQIVVVCLSLYFRNDLVANVCGVAEHWERLLQAFGRWLPLIGRDLFVSAFRLIEQVDDRYLLLLSNVDNHRRVTPCSFSFFGINHTNFSRTPSLPPESTITDFPKIKA